MLFDVSNYFALMLLLHLRGICGVSNQENEVLITDVIVPAVVERGTEAKLKCVYDLARLKLYSIKWYHDDKEFFRYMPTEGRTKDTVDANHRAFKVDLIRSTGPDLYLTDMDTTAEGRYKCEVLSDSPHFHTHDKSAFLSVVVKPRGEPEIRPNQQSYRPNDTAQILCVAPPAMPRAINIWYINGKQVPSSMVQQLPDKMDEQTSLPRTQTILQFLVTRDHFQGGSMSLRCSSGIPSNHNAAHYFSSSEKLEGSDTVHFEELDRPNRSWSNEGHHSDVTNILRDTLTEGKPLVFWAPSSSHRVKGLLLQLSYSASDLVLLAALCTIFKHSVFLLS